MACICTIFFHWQCYKVTRLHFSVMLYLQYKDERSNIHEISFWWEKLQGHKVTRCYCATLSKGKRIQGHPYVRFSLMCKDTRTQGDTFLYCCDLKSKDTRSYILIPLFNGRGYLITRLQLSALLWRRIKGYKDKRSWKYIIFLWWARLQGHKVTLFCAVVTFNLRVQLQIYVRSYSDMQGYNVT